VVFLAGAGLLLATALLAGPGAALLHGVRTSASRGGMHSALPSAVHASAYRDPVDKGSLAEEAFLAVETEFCCFSAENLADPCGTCIQRGFPDSEHLCAKSRDNCQRCDKSWCATMRPLKVAVEKRTWEEPLWQTADKGGQSFLAATGEFCCLWATDPADPCKTCSSEVFPRDAHNNYCGQSRSNCGRCGKSWCDASSSAREAGNEAEHPPMHSCLAYGCNDYREDNACQCNVECAIYQDCCHDFEKVCAPAGMAATTTVAPAVTSPCLIAPFDSECYKRVMWVMRNGIFEHPDWYPKSNIWSSFEEVQTELHEKSECHCPKPCNVPPDPSLVDLPKVRKKNSTAAGAKLLQQVTTSIVKHTIGNLCGNVSAVKTISNDDAPIWQIPKHEVDRCFDQLLEHKVVQARDRKIKRNWCWVGLKELGCHRHYYDHLTWLEMQRLAVKANVTSNSSFHPLRNWKVCDSWRFGGSVAWTSAHWAAAMQWFQDTVSAAVLSLPGSTRRRDNIKERLDHLRIEFTFIDGVDFRKPGSLKAAKEEGLIPADFNMTLAQEEAFSARQGMAGGISGTLGCASGHFRAQRHALGSKKPISLVFEDDVSPEDDFVPKLWRLVTQELPCDWQAVSLFSRCPFGECVSPHLTRVQPDVNEPAWRCRHGVNYGFQGMLYRTDELEALQRVWKPAVFDERHPHCLDVDVALASISDRVRFYAVPAVHSPGFLRELPEGSERFGINWQKISHRHGRHGG